MRILLKREKHYPSSVENLNVPRKYKKTWVYNGTLNILDNAGNKVKISHISHLQPYGIETQLKKAR